MCFFNSLVVFKYFTNFNGLHIVHTNNMWHTINAHGWYVIENGVNNKKHGMVWCKIAGTMLNSVSSSLKKVKEKIINVKGKWSYGWEKWA